MDTRWKSGRLSVKLVREKDVNRGHLVRTICAGDPNTPLLPGDMVRHWQDSQSSGTVISVSDDGRVNGDLEAMVLWTKLPFNGQYPPSPVMPTDTNPCAEVTLMTDMFTAGIISKKTMYEHLGLDPDEQP